MTLETQNKLKEYLKDYKAGKNGHGDTPIDENEVIIKFKDLLEEEKAVEKFIINKKTGKKVLTPADIVFEETEITLSEKVYKLKKYSVPIKWHFMDKYEDFAQRILSPSNDKIFAEVAYKLLKDETAFMSFEKFANAISDNKDMISIVEAVNRAMGQADLAFMTDDELEAWKKEKKL